MTQPKDVDINVQLRALQEDKVKVTFNDIWRDYKMYKKSYYFHQVQEKAKVTQSREQVPVDIDAFSYRSYIKWLVFEAHRGPIYEPSVMFSKLLFITFILVGFWVI